MSIKPQKRNKATKVDEVAPTKQGAASYEKMSINIDADLFDPITDYVYAKKKTDRAYNKSKFIANAVREYMVKHKII